MTKVKDKKKIAEKNKGKIKEVLKVLIPLLFLVAAGFVIGVLWEQTGRFSEGDCYTYAHQGWEDGDKVTWKDNICIIEETLGNMTYKYDIQCHGRHIRYYSDKDIDMSFDSTWSFSPCFFGKVKQES